MRSIQTQCLSTNGKCDNYLQCYSLSTSVLVTKTPSQSYSSKQLEVHSIPCSLRCHTFVAEWQCLVILVTFLLSPSRSLQKTRVRQTPRMQYYQIYFAVAHLFLFLSPLPHLQCPQNILYPYSPLFCKIPISPLGIADQYTLRTIARKSSTEHPQSSTQCSILYQPWVSEQTIKTICFPALNNLFNMKDPDDTIR